MTDPHGARPAQKPLAETIVGTLSAFLVLAFLIFLSFQAITGDESPPDLAASPESVQRSGTGTLLRVKIVNHGEKAAAGVTVRAETGTGSGREINFDYVAAGSVQRGAFLFDSPDVTADDVSLSIYGFVEP